MADSSEHDDSQEFERPSSRVATLTLVILVGINLLNYLDRYTVAGVLPLLQNQTSSGFSADLDDGEAGLLMTAFIVSYMLFSPVFGYYGDRTNRKTLIFIGVLFWSLFTVAGSFSTSYPMLLAARALVGIGEASYATIAPTIIADLYPANVRTSVLSVFYLAIPVGSALGFIVGSEAAAIMGSWRWALRVSPPLGAVLAFILFFFSVDPPRGMSDGAGAGADAKGGHVNTTHGFKAFFDDCRLVLRSRSFTWSVLGATAVTFTAGALAQWIPTFLVRQAPEGYSDKTASLLFGGITCITGVGGTLLGAYLSKIYTPRTLKADGYICGLGLLGCVPFLCMALPLTSFSSYATGALVFFGEIFLCLNWAPASAILLYVIPPEQRSSAEAISILVQHLLGDAFSPYLVGLVSDTLHQNHGFTDGDSLMFALFIPSFVALLGGYAFLRAANYLPRDRERATGIHHTDAPINEERQSLIRGGDM